MTEEEKKEKRLATAKAWRAANREHIKNYRAKNKTRSAEYRKIWYQKNKDQKLAQNKKWRETNKERKAAMNKTWNENNKDRLRAWHKAHRNHTNAQRRVRHKTDPQFRLSRAIRSRFHKIVKHRYGRKSFQSHIRFLGCTLAELRVHLEQQFEPWMTWENHGVKGWHIDHIKPLSSFDLTDPEQVKQACHYTNLRPVHWRENLSKGARVIEKHEAA